MQCWGRGQENTLVPGKKKCVLHAIAGMHGVASHACNLTEKGTYLTTKPPLK